MSWLSRLFSRPTRQSMADWLDDGGRPIRRRPYRRDLESTETNRLNETHWSRAEDVPVNTLLARKLETLRARCLYESLNNPFVEGVIETHCGDLVGESGPILQVVSPNKEYNDALEAGWAEFWASPEIGGQVSGPGLLRMLVRSCWLCGEFLLQIVNGEPNKAGTVTTRVKAIHPRRLATPPNRVGDEQVLLGVRRNREGKVLGYHIETTQEGDSLRSLGFNYEYFEAANIIHQFRVLEPDQVRGLPWLNSSLPTIADLRDYDKQVMEAAKLAAASGLTLETVSPDIQPIQVDGAEPMDLVIGSILPCPPGYTARQIQPNQPASTYLDFRSERLRELGRPVGMPLMMVQLDSRRHNYSSARFDSQVYQRENRRVQRWMCDGTLNRLFRLIQLEVEANRRMQRPKAVKVNWIWPKFPHVDPKKEGEAATERLVNGTSCLRDECAAIDKDWEDVQEQRKREGLPSAGELLGRKASTPAAADQDGDGKDEEENDDAKSGRKNWSAAA
jgi:lambda family phage portal protein